MTPQEQDFVVRVITDCAAMLNLHDSMRRRIAEWNLNGFDSSITTGNLALVDSLKHLTQAELTACITAFQAIETALGDDVSGNRSNLIKATR